MDAGRMHAFLLGRNRRTSVRFFGVGMVVASSFAVLLYTPAGRGLSSTHYFQLLSVVTFGCAAVSAYVNGGLLTSWFLAASGILPFAFSFALTDAPLGQEPTIVSAINALLLSAGLYTVAVGTTAFAIGAGVRYGRDRPTKPTEARRPEE
ncbi:hypothetical protein [Halomicrococcus sp. SG-WS-1]|uniref:hypothetical protein n=1 Tax=Halomicrococcus sp. SG-WS-1 TaxID=3439057 RepID=UPI003F7ADB1D